MTEVVDNDDEGGSGGATAASTVASGTGGQTVEPGRGNPSDFPAECIPNCVQACERLALCEGDKSSLYPLDRDECLARCDIAQNGPLWDDQSGNFLCCAAQDSCDARQHCGGWLKHPDANKSCDALCGCFFSGAVSALTDGKSAPDGYRFAPDLITIAPKASVRFNALDGVSVFHAGSYPVLRLSDKAPKNTASRLSTYGDVLPPLSIAKAESAPQLGCSSSRCKTPPKSLVEARTAHLGALQSIPYGRSLFLFA